MNPIPPVVKQVCTYLLFIVVTLYATPLQQLLKLPVLMVHYAEHKHQQKELDFLDFIFMHYIGEDGVSSDNDRDMELPFKKSDNAHIYFDVYTPMAVVFSRSTEPYQTRGQHPIRQQQCPENAFEPTLLKPPIA